MNLLTYLEWDHIEAMEMYGFADERIKNEAAKI